jgi:3-oxoacyl-[acyl-carrier protein] reductase
VDLGLSKKVALVAASSRGLGRAVAREMALEGARLVICSRDVRAIEDARQEIYDESQTEVIAVPADLSEPEDVDRLFAAAISEFGQVDVLVTNTGGPPPGPFESHSPETWDRAVRQNLSSVLNLCRAALPGMKERRWGRIVNITSIAVKQPVDGLILSNSIRAAVTGFAKTLANEVAPFGVTVNNVMPGYHQTERLEALAESIAQRQEKTREDVFDAWEQVVPMARIGDPSEFAAMVTFLASERASYITGSSVAVDGGSSRGLL